MGTVFTSALPPAPGQPQRRAAPHRCVRRPVAFGYYVTRQSPPGQRVPAPGAPADSPPGREDYPQAQLLVLFRTCRSRWRSGDNVASLRALLGLALILGSKSGCYAVLCKQASEATLAKFV